MPEATLDEITAEIKILVKKHVYSDVRISFRDVLNMRNRLYHFLERRQYPQQTKQLHYLISIVCALLSDTNLSLGFSKEAAKQGQVSWSYAEIIGSNSLRVEARRTLAWIAYLDNRPQQALDIALSATTWATEPLARAGLQSARLLFRLYCPS